MNREQIKELFEHNMFVETLEYFFVEVDKEQRIAYQKCWFLYETVGKACSKVERRILTSSLLREGLKCY